MCARPDPRSAAEQESQRLWRLAGMGGTLASEILGGALIGWLLDLFFGTKPTLLIVFTMIGLIVGMTTFIRSALKQQARQEMPEPPLENQAHSSDD